MKEKQPANKAEIGAAAETEMPGWKKRTALYLSGQTISLFGSSLVQFAIIWHITLSTQMGGSMAIASICGFAPQVLISLFSGVWADRMNRKILIIFADALVATSTLVLVMFFLAGHDDLWMIYLVLIVRSIGSGIQAPAVNALLPQLVPKSKIIHISGINGSLQSITFLLAPAISGAILAVASIEFAFMIDVGTAVIAIIIMIILKVPTHEKALLKQKGGYLDDLKAGIKYVMSSGFFRAFFLFYAILMFCLAPASQLAPLMVARTFGAEMWRLSVTEVMWSVGSVVGGVLISVWGGFKNRTKTVALAAVLFGVTTFLLGIAQGFIVFQVVMVISGTSMPMMATPSMAIVQEQVQTDMQGRVFSMMQIVMTSMVPLGMVLFGPLADIMPIQILFMVTGISIAILGVGMHFNKHFRTGLINNS